METINPFVEKQNKKKINSAPSTGGMGLKRSIYINNLNFKKTATYLAFSVRNRLNTCHKLIKYYKLVDETPSQIDQ